MISRRLLRIKALQSLYAFNRKEGDDLVEAERELITGIGKAYDLYIYLLLLCNELAYVAETRIDAGLRKKMPAWEDLNPNRRFVDNRIIRKLILSDELTKTARDRSLSWNGYGDIARLLFNRLAGLSIYSEYLNSAEDNIVVDRKFVCNMLSWLLEGSEDLLLHLEERSIYWNDDLEFALIMIEKTIKSITEAEDSHIVVRPLFKNEEDEHFAIHLIRNALLKDQLIRKLIDSNTTNWEIERIALMDILVMQLAVAEIMAFPEIPVKVTLNEYIEIVKYYSTSKSSTFINGILDKIVKEMKANAMFTKTGRGLIGEKS